MVKKSKISNWGGVLFILLCFILVIGRSEGMIALFAVFSLLTLFKIKNIKPDNTAILLLVFSFLYIITSYINGAVRNLSSIIIYGLPWFIFYSYGKFVANGTQNDRDIVDFIIIIALCMGLTAYVSTIQKVIISGSIVDVTRSFYLFNNENYKFAGTSICVGVYVGYIGLTAFFLLAEWKWERWAFLLLFVLSILVAVNVVTRFPIAAAAICFLFILFLKYKGRSLRLLGILLLVSVIFFILYYQGGGIGQVFEAYSVRNEDMDNVSTLSSRTIIWSEALQNLFIYPFGWYGKADSHSFMHNMWLDIAKYSGIIPFLLLCTVTIKSFITNFKILRIQRTTLAYILLALNLCFCLVVFVEPVFGGLVAGVGCMVWGVQESYLQDLKQLRL